MPSLRDHFALRFNRWRGYAKHGIYSGAIAKVLRCSVLNLTWALPKKDNSAIPQVGTSPCRLGNVRRKSAGRSIVSLGDKMDQPTVPQTELADDILRGADEIATFIFGERGSRRKVYYLAECSRLPVFRLGSVLCARRSVLLGWISGQERRVIDPARDVTGR